MNEWRCESWIFLRGGDAFIFLSGNFLEGIGLAWVDIPKQKCILAIKSLYSLKLVVPETSLDPLLCSLLCLSVHSRGGEGQTKRRLHTYGARASLFLGFSLDGPHPQGRLGKSSESRLLNRVSRDTLEHCCSLSTWKKKVQKTQVILQVTRLGAQFPSGELLPWQEQQ